MGRFKTRCYPDGFISFKGNVELTKDQLEYIEDIIDHAIFSSYSDVDDFDKFDKFSWEMEFGEGCTDYTFQGEYILYQDGSCYSNPPYRNNWGDWEPGDYDSTEERSVFNFNFYRSLLEKGIQSLINRGVLPELEILDMEKPCYDLDYDEYDE